jgi:hypothetical protein
MNTITQVERDRILDYALTIVSLDVDGIVVDAPERVDQVMAAFGITRQRARAAVAKAARRLRYARVKRREA